MRGVVLEFEGVSPAGPKRGVVGTAGAPQTQPSECQRQARQLPNSQCPRCVQQLLGAVPHVLIVSSRESL